MANTFFGFDSTLENEANLLGVGEDDCTETEEDEYDALNDETFGALEDSTALDDWEQQHEQFAEYAESSKQNIEDSINKTLIDIDDMVQIEPNIDELVNIEPDLDLLERNLDKIAFDKSKIGLLQSAFLSTIKQTWLQDQFQNLLPSHRSQQQQQQLPLQQPQIHQQLPPHHQLQQLQQHQLQQQQLKQQHQSMIPSAPSPITNQIPKKICTVEELEREIRQHNAVLPHPHPQQQPQPPLKQNVLPPNLPPNHPLFQHDQFMGGVNVPPRLPPGLHHPGMRMPPPPGLRHLPPGLPPPPNIPPGFRMVPPHPAYDYYMNHSHVPPVMNMMVQGGPRNSNPGMVQQMARHQQNNRNINNNNQRQDGRRKDFEPKDEYAGLMSNREKQWLLNIQQLQVNTGTPYFDDYYYTIFKERKARNNKENQPGMERNQRYQRHNRNQDRQENTLTARVYTPLQFENSLGKLQCGSVTAPRKIIDMDVVTLEKETENTPTRDTRKTKQLLLELEGLYSLMLKAEDLRNPLAITNMEKLVELKQKQRLRELEAASTPEQKQEILKLLQQESVPSVDNPTDHINKVMNSLMQDDKFTSYLNIRKGKMLLLRVLPHLTADNFNGSFLELWTKVLLSLPVIGRRDTLGDNILLRLHPYFKRYIQSSTMQNILDLATNLIEIVRQENSRSTPLSHQSRAPLYFVATNKFGVSALATMFVRTEYLASAGNVSEKQLAEWTKFVSVWEERACRTNLATPIERIPRPIFVKHANRIGLASDKREFLERYYVEL